MAVTRTQYILINGVSGHIGFRVLREALTAGHRVKAVLRKESQIARIQSVVSIQQYLPMLSFVVIPDLAAAGAYDQALRGAWAIIHIATPTFSGFGNVNVSEFLSNAWSITANTLASATKSPSIKRVVITSSISAITPFLEDGNTSTEYFTNESPIMTRRLESLPEEAPEAQAYVLSKIYVADKVRSFVESNSVGFSVVNVIPGTTIGPNELAASPREVIAGSNMSALGPLLGIKFSPIPSILSHIDDVAFAHVKALDVDVPPGSIANSLPVFNSKANPAPFDWDDSIQIVREDFPEAESLFPLGGTVPVARLWADSTADEELLGRKFKGYREAVGDVVRQYIELASESK